MEINNAKGCVRGKLEIKRNLIQIIQSLTDSYEIDMAMLDAALDTAFGEIDESLEDFQLQILDRGLWHFFGEETGLWIGCRTPAGNAIPADVLAAAYTMWRKALYFADNRGVDGAKASAAMVKAVNATADDLARERTVGDVRRYLFGVYRHKIARITRKLGFAHRSVRLTEKHLSDAGVALSKVDNEILCRELLDAMPPMGRAVAVLRFGSGCSWEETAEKTGRSVNAVQKALSTGLRKAFEVCMEDGRSSKNAGTGRRKHSKGQRYKPE